MHHNLKNAPVTQRVENKRTFKDLEAGLSEICSLLDILSERDEVLNDDKISLLVALTEEIAKRVRKNYYDAWHNEYGGPKPV